MKLSEAILKGCEMVPKQMYHTYFLWDWDRVEGACAIGTAAVAIEGMIGATEKLIEYEARLLHRAGELVVMYHNLEIPYRNDTIQETREQIAADLARRGL